MKIMVFSDYEKVAKVNDRIILGGKGILDGLSYKAKSNTHKVVRVSENHISLTAYRSKTIVCVQDGYRDQDVAILSAKEFAELPIF